MNVSAGQNTSWWSKEVSRLACWVAVAVALAGALPAQAGSILLTAKLLEEWRSATAGDSASHGSGELELATKSFEKRDFDACLKQLGQAVKAHPELPPAHALFAQLAISDSQAPLIRPALERAVSEDPAHPEVYILFGKLALLEGRATDASLHFEKATALASSPRWTAGQRDHFEQLCHQGNASVAEGRGDWKAARAALEGWLKLESTNALARRRLGQALFRVGELKVAYQELERAAKEDSTLEPAAITMGWLYTRAGDSNKAQEWMNYAVKTAPDSLGVRIGLAAWLLERGRPEQAQTHADAAARLDAQSQDARRLLGLAARARRDLARSESIFQALAAESSGDAWVRNQLALVLAEQADDAKRRKALELAELSVRQAPGTPEAMATLGMVLYHLHRLDEGEKLLQAVVDSGQGSPDAAYVLARIKADRGRVDGVRALLKPALAAPGFFVCRAEAQQWLDRLSASPKSGS